MQLVSGFSSLYPTPDSFKTHFNGKHLPLRGDKSVFQPIVDQIHFGNQVRPATSPSSDPSHMDFESRVSTVKDYLEETGKFPLYASVTLRYLTDLTRQPSNVCMAAISDLYSEGKLLPINIFNETSWRDMAWTTTKNNQPEAYQISILADNPAMLRFLKDSNYYNNFLVEHKFANNIGYREKQKMRANVHQDNVRRNIEYLITALIGAQPSSTFLIHTPNNPEIFTEALEPMGYTLAEINKALTKISPAGDLQERTRNFRDLGRAQFELTQSGDDDDKRVENEYERHLDSPIRVVQTLTRPIEEQAEDHQSSRKILKSVIEDPNAKPGQSVIDRNLLGATVYDALDPQRRYISHRGKFLSLASAQYDPKLRRKPQQGNLITGYYNFSESVIRTPEKDFVEAYDKNLDLAMLGLIANGLIDDRYKFTSKILQYQQTEPLVERYNDAEPSVNRNTDKGKEKHFSIYLVPPIEEESDTWKVGYCWTLPKKAGESDSPRIGIPSHVYNLPSFSFDATRFQNETEVAMQTASDIYPELKRATIPNIPPQPINLGTADIITFAHNYAHRLHKAGIDVLLPTKYLEAATKSEEEDDPFEVKQGALEGLPILPGQRPFLAEIDRHHMLSTGQWQPLENLSDARKFEKGVKRLAEDSDITRKAKDEDSVFIAQSLLAKLSKITDFTEETQKPAGFGTELLPFQMTGYSFIKHRADNNLGAILADEMGLGKTVQSLAVIQDRYNRQKSGQLVKKPTLIVCPNSVIQEWKDHIYGKTPTDESPGFNGLTGIKKDQVIDVQEFLANYYNKKENREKPRGKQVNDIHSAFKNAAIVICSYETMRDREQLLSTEPGGWDGIWLDEAHRIRSPIAKWTDAARSLSHTANYRVALSGTPIQNHIGDLWALGTFVAPRRDDRVAAIAFPTLKEYRKEYIRPLNRDRIGTLDKLITQLKPYMLRRTRETPSVQKDIKNRIPPIHHHYIFTPLNSEQINLTRQADHLKETPLKMITTYRQIALHPALFRRNVPAPGKADATGSRVSFEPTESMKALGDIIEDRVLPKNEQIVVFSPYMEFNSMLQRYLFERLGVGCLLFDSAHQSTPEGHPIELFKRKKYPVLIMIDKSGGEGLNLQNANHVADFSPSWNPQAQNQRIARVHRLQPMHDSRKFPDVHVYHFVTYIKEHADTNVSKEDQIWQKLMPDRKFAPLEVPNNGLATIDVLIENILRNKKLLAADLLDNDKITIPEQNTRALLSQTLQDNIRALQRQ